MYDNKNLQDANALGAMYSAILKKYVNAGRIPPFFEHLSWNVEELGREYAKNRTFCCLPDFLFETFYTIQNLEEKKTRQIVKSESEANETDISPLDLTGCPLECPFEFTNFEEDTLQGQEPSGPSRTLCKAEYARLLLNLYLYEIHKSLSAPFPLLIFCDGLDPQSTVLLGAFKEFNGVSHIQATKLPGTFSAASAPSMKNFKRELSEVFPKKGIVPEFKVQSVYQILEGTSSSPSSLTLTCQWEDPLVLLEPPSSNFLCTLDAHISLGDPRSPLSSLYKELSFLERTFEGLEHQEIVWHVQNTDDALSMSERLHRLIEVTKNVRHCYSREEDSVVGEDNELGISIEGILIKKRQNLDFTDNLWNTLMKVSSYEELKDGFSYVTNAISRGEVKPVVLRNNKTTLGQWIVAHLKGKESCMPLDGIEPLKLLAEIGLRKIQEDYCSLFLGLQLATQDILNPYFRKWDDPESVSCLQVLQATLELVLLCKVFLNLPQHILGSFARQVLTGGNFTGKYNFTFQVPHMVLHAKLQSLNCSEWQVCGALSSPTLTMKTSLHFANKLLPHLQESSATSGLSQKHTYHGTKYVYVKNFM